MKTPEKPKRLCADCDHYEVCQAHSHAGVLHELNAVRCALYSDRTHDRKRIAVLELVVEEGNKQIEQLERELDAAVAAMPRWISVEERLPLEGERVLVTNGPAGGFVCESYLNAHNQWMRGGVEMFFMTPHYWKPLPEPPMEADHADAT